MKKWFLKWYWPITCGAAMVVAQFVREAVSGDLGFLAAIGVILLIICPVAYWRDRKS